tara:strand:- start:4840 stop:5430 length:591 start_codon:yes stop_codon:yes gene_type:complete
VKLPEKFKLVTWPDPILEETCRPVSVEELLADEEGRTPIMDLFEGMEEVLWEHDGFGLAAPQVGVSVQAIIIRLPDDSILRVVNPIISRSKGKPGKSLEGCLSYPGINGALSCRYPEVLVTYQTETGGVATAPFKQMAATVFQHEYDHLYGQTILTRMGRVQRRMKLKKLRRNHERSTLSGATRRRRSRSTRRSRG